MASKKNKKKLIVPDTITAETVNDQLEKKNSQKALDYAKRFHKQCQNGESEKLLAKAYHLRIKQLKAGGLGKEAVQIIAVAKEKCPKFVELFEEAEFEAFQFPLTEQDVKRLLGMLQLHKDSHEKTEQLYTILKNGLSDIRHILQCSELAADHPLQQEATIVWEAFETAAGECSGSARGQRMHRLAQVSRQSILVNWCYLIRALDAFHQFDDSKAKLLIDRISEDSTVSRAAAFLKEQLEGKLIPKGLTAKPTRLLWNAMREDSLRTQWMKICHLIKTRQGKALYTAVQPFFRSPFFSSPLMLRLALQSFINEMIHVDYFENKFFNLVESEFKRMWGKDGNKLLSLSICCGLEKHDDPYFVAEQFENSENEWQDVFTKQERSMILARAAKCYEEDEREEASCSFPFLFKKKRVEHTDSIRLFTKANRLCPKIEYYQKLVPLQRDSGYKWKEIESTLMQWNHVFPKDVTPLIYLIEAAEERNTLQKALQYLEQAEQIDHLNPKVRDSRHKLVWQNIKKHLKQKKWHLVRRDLEQVDLSSMKPAKQTLFRGVERFLSYLESDCNTKEADSIPIENILLIHHLNYAAGMKIDNKLNQLLPLPELCDAVLLDNFFDVREALISIHDVPAFPVKWMKQFPEWILSASNIKNGLLLRICQTVNSYYLPYMVFAATARGLQECETNIHKFMYYRAYLIISKNWDSENVQMESYFAALHLAKQQHDDEFVRLCQMKLGNDLYMMLDEIGVNTQKINVNELIALTEEELAEILQRERKRKYPPETNSRWGGTNPAKKPSKIVDRIMKNIPLSQRFLEDDEDDEEFEDVLGEMLEDEFDKYIDGIVEELENVVDGKEDKQETLW